MIETEQQRQTLSISGETVRRIEVPMKRQLSCIPSITQLSDYMEFSRQFHAAFEYNEFFLPAVLDNEEKRRSLMFQYMNLDRDRSNDTLHGAFLDICINSDDPKIFAISDLRVRQCMEIAKEMGVKAVIFHTNYIVNFRLPSYLGNWLDKNEIYWKNILNEYPEQNIYLENMFDDTPDLLTRLAKRMENVPRFAVCLDTAHAFISGSPLHRWFDSLKPYISHLHINDNNGIADLHQPVGSGIFPWNDFQQWIMSLEKKPSLLIEVRNFEDLQKSVEFMQENHIYPFHVS